MMKYNNTSCFFRKKGEKYTYSLIITQFSNYICLENTLNAYQITILQLSYYDRLVG